MDAPGLLAGAGIPLAQRNRALNRTHAMAGMRQRGGRVVRAIEARRRRLVADAVRAGPHARVLDAGCEDGWIAEGYAHGVRDLVLFDLDGELLAGGRLAGLEGVRTVVGDVTDPQALTGHVARGSVDVVVLSALLEHLPCPDLALAALAPLLSARGRFVVYLPADGPILLLKSVLRALRLGGLVRGLSLEPAPGHLHRFTRRRIVRLLAAHGRVLSVDFDPLVLGTVAVVRPRARAPSRVEPS